MHMRIGLALAGLTALLSLAGCPGSSSAPINPFLTLVDGDFLLQGQTTTGTTGTGGASGTSGTTAPFRRDMLVSFVNRSQDFLHDDLSITFGSDLQFQYAAWVNPSSIHSTVEEDSLINGGYTRLTTEVRLGTAYVLPPGTFVYAGPGVAGATRVTIPRGFRTTAAVSPQLLDAGIARAGSVLRNAGTAYVYFFQVTLPAPDVLLVFADPPVSCDSVAFTFMDAGQVENSDPVNVGEGTFAGNTNTGGRMGGYKTLAQVDAYSCSAHFATTGAPVSGFTPGLFLKTSGGARLPNEFFEGDPVSFQFRDVPDAGNHQGNFCIVTYADEVANAQAAAAAAAAAGTNQGQ
jgi:hypothetical protein